MLVRLYMLTVLVAFLPGAGLADGTWVDDLSFENLRGGQESLRHYRGTVTVLNFWATWCQPCREEMPLFVSLKEEYGSRGVEFIAASRDVAESLEKVRRFVAKYHIEFPVWVNVTAEQQAAFRLATALPATAIIDRDGRLHFRIIGQAHRDTLTERLDWLLSDQAKSPPTELLLPAGMSPEHFEEHESGEEHDHADERANGGGSEVPS